MNFFEKILYFLQGEMPEPMAFGWFHFLCLFIILGFTIFICVKFKNCSDKTFRRIVLIGWIVILVLEIYKQLVFSFNYNGVNAWWDYQWYAFPFQLCSTPLYLLPFVAFLKDGKVRDAIIAFLATYSLFGGLTVMVSPNSVLIETIGVNIQTMVHHGLQVAFGVFFMIKCRHKLNHKFFLRAIPVFLAVWGVAMGLNAIVPNFTNETFNMFYISPLFENDMPVLGDVFNAVPYGVFLLAYVICFTLISVFLYYFQYFLLKRCKTKQIK